MKKIFDKDYRFIVKAKLVAVLACMQSLSPFLKTNFKNPFH